MMRLLVFFFILENIFCSCPTGFELVRDGECRGKYATISASWSSVVSSATSKCKEIQGKPIIIHDEEHQSYWRSRTPSSDYTFIDLICNTTSFLWHWGDGSVLNYKSSDGYNVEYLDGACETDLKGAWDIHSDGLWNYGESATGATFHIFCTTQLQQPIGDGCESFDDDSEDGLCYQIHTNVQTWQDAQTTCRNTGATVASIHNLQENSFIRRLAVSKGAVNGVYLGATISGKGKSFGWIDGSEWDYDYFYPGFPVDGHGDCLAMDTFSPSGEWMNMDCSSKLTVVCAKRATARPACTSGPWKEGQVIYSPGYPYDASTPCDYFLSVAAGKRVQVEVLLLEANTCCDRLLLSDDVLGGKVVANLTGEITDKTYTTQSSNLMRVSWQPNGGVNVRGMMMTFRAV